jgi:hypothetical protein
MVEESRRSASDIASSEACSIEGFGVLEATRLRHVSFAVSCDFFEHAVHKVDAEVRCRATSAHVFSVNSYMNQE